MKLLDSPQCLVDKSELFEVADSAVGHPGRAAQGALAEISLLDKHDRLAPERRVPSAGSSVNPAFEAAKE